LRFEKVVGIICQALPKVSRANGVQNVEDRKLFNVGR
jgi:hypothetical protein